MATRLKNLQKAAFYAGLLEVIVVEIENHKNRAPSPLAVANLRRRFDDMNRHLNDALKHAKK